MPQHPCKVVLSVLTYANTLKHLGFTKACDATSRYVESTGWNNRSVTSYLEQQVNGFRGQRV